MAFSGSRAGHYAPLSTDGNGTLVANLNAERAWTFEGGARHAAGELVLYHAPAQAEALDGGQLMSGPAIKRGVIAATSPALFTEWSAWIKARS